MELELEPDAEGLLQWQQFMNYRKQARHKHVSWGREIDLETEQTQCNDFKRMSVHEHPGER